MEWIKACVKPTILIVFWVAVIWYTLSLASTVEPALRLIGAQA